MAGGTFTLNNPKKRPGVYVNLKNGRDAVIGGSSRGVATVPFLGYDWGERDTMIQVSASSPDGQIAKLGRSVYDDNDSMLLLQLILLGATTVYVYIPDGGTAASKSQEIGETPVTFTAKYKGTLGNKIQIVSEANPAGGFDVSISVDGTVKETYEGIKKVNEIKDSNWIKDPEGETDLTAFASFSLESGTDASTEAKEGLTKYLDASEKIKFNCMCWPSEDVSLQQALLTKIKYIRNNIGWKCQAVAPKFAANYEGIINMSNSFVYNGKELTVAQAGAWMCGATAGADYVTSNTYVIVPNATAVVGELNNEEAEKAIADGKTFFTVDDNGAVILETDINSRIQFDPDTPTNIYKNRPLRVYDTFANDCLVNFRPNKFDGDEDGYTVIEGLGRRMLSLYEEDGAIRNVNLEADFTVDRERSADDFVYISVGLQAVDSVEKFYITVTAR